MHKKTIIWDWNGTLLNDTSICINAINKLLVERNKETIDTSIYREIFTFPVRDYYIKAGFNFDEEPFEKPALEFIDLYDEMISEATLFNDAKDTLEAIKSRGYRQVILSAMQQEFLLATVAKQGIKHFFSTISGIDNHYAEGKLANARRLIASLDGHAGGLLVEERTIHDHEVGSELDIDVILVARGHQSERRLRETGRKVVQNFTEVLNLI